MLKGNRHKTKGEKATSGVHPSAGSGVYKTPVAHLAVLMDMMSRFPVVQVVLLVFGVGSVAELFQLVVTTRQAAEDAVVATVSEARVVLALASDVFGSASKACSSWFRLIGTVASDISKTVSKLLRYGTPVLIVCLVLWLSLAGWKSVRSAFGTVLVPEAHSMCREPVARRRREVEEIPEVGRQERSSGHLSRGSVPRVVPAQVRSAAKENVGACADLVTKGPSDYKKGILTDRLVAGFLRSGKIVQPRRIAERLQEVGAVTKVPGESGEVFEVCLDLEKVSQGDLTGVTCTCLDHVMHGAGCEHAGGVLYALMGYNGPGNRWTGEVASSRVGLVKALKDKSESGDGPAVADGVGLPARLRRGPDHSSSSTDAWRVQVATIKTKFRLGAIGDVARKVREIEKADYDAMHKDFSEDRADPAAGPVARTVEVVKTSSDAGTQTEKCLGVVKNLLDACLTHEVALRAVSEAKSFVRVLAYTFDLPDLTEQLVRAHKRGIDTVIGVDRRFFRGGTCRSMGPMLRKLHAEGVVVKLCSGVSLAAAYRTVARTVGGIGIQHSKVLLTEQTALVGSTNWTTSSKGNLEVAVELDLTVEGCSELRTLIDARLARGDDFGID